MIRKIARWLAGGVLLLALFLVGWRIAEAQSKFVTISWSQVQNYTNGGAMTPTETANLTYYLWAFPANDQNPDDDLYIGSLWAGDPTYSAACPPMPAVCFFQTWITSGYPCIAAVTFDPAIDLSIPGSNRNSAFTNFFCVTFP